MDDIQELKAKRFQFLKKLYEQSGGDEFEWCNEYTIGKTLGFDRNETDKIAHYLISEGLLKRQARGTIGITHSGVCEVEEALSNPDKNTEHFPPVNIISIGSIGRMINSQIRQAPEADTQVPVGDKVDSTEMQCDSIIEALRKEFLTRTHRDLQKKESQIGREYQLKGMYASSSYVNVILEAEFEHKQQLLDYLMQSVEKNFPNIPMAYFRDKLFTVIEEEYGGIIPVMERLLNRISMGVSLGICKAKIAKEQEGAKTIVETRCIISQGKVSMTKQSIFISHAKEDACVAEAVKTQIDNVFGKALKVFVSSIPGAIPPGSEWFDEIVRSLTENNAFIVLVTPNSVGRPFVWFEIGFSWLRKHTKTCEMYVVCAPPIQSGELPQPLDRLQAISLAKEDETKAFFEKLIDQFKFGNLDTLDFTEISKSLPKYDEEKSKPAGEKIRSEVIQNEIINFLMGDIWYRAELLISHLSQSFPKDSVVDQLTEMERHGIITWGGGPMKSDSQVRMCKSAK